MKTLNLMALATFGAIILLSSCKPDNYGEAQAKVEKPQFGIVLEEQGNIDGYCCRVLRDTKTNRRILQYKEGLVILPEEQPAK